MNKDILIKVGCVAAGAAAGSTITYFVARKHIRKQAFEWADAEIESVKDTYKLLRKQPPYDDPATAVKAYTERLDELQFMAEQGIEAAEEAAAAHVAELTEELEDAVDDLEEVSKVEDILADQGYAEASETVHNIFDKARQVHADQKAAENDEEPFDELRNRDPRPPFHITFDDFFDDSNDFDKITITYFEADKTLADDHEEIIPDIEGVVGRENMTKFGQESDDKNTVYVRNERLRVDYEVTREEGSYVEIVHGYNEMVESRDKRIRKMRDDE